MSDPDQTTFVCRGCHHAFPMAAAVQAPPAGFFKRLFNREPKPHCPKCQGSDLVEADSAPITTRIFKKKK
jgi:hypothetical protein